jgi:transcription elongation factor Elf1
VGRRGIKEYRAPEALILIAADRDQKPLVCPSCGSTAVERTPARTSDEFQVGRVTLHCNTCGRSAVYIPRALSSAVLPEAPRPHP